MKRNLLLDFSLVRYQSHIYYHAPDGRYESPEGMLFCLFGVLSPVGSEAYPAGSAEKKKIAESSAYFAPLTTLSKDEGEWVVIKIETMLFFSKQGLWILSASVFCINTSLHHRF